MTSPRVVGRWWAGLAVTALLAGSTAHAEAAPPLVTTLAVASSSADDPVNRVVAISVDGLNPRAIRKLGPSGAPNFHRLLREGRPP